MTKIQIGSETWSYEIDGAYTNIEDEDGERTLQLRWAVKSEDEVRAAAYGFGAGRHIGEKIGRAAKLREIHAALEIPPQQT